MKRLVLVLGISALLAPVVASANQRHYGYIHETATLPMGAAEIEPWTTVRLMRDDYYVRFDHRLEFELGLLDNLQAAFYVNWSEVTAAIPGSTALNSSSGFDGFSVELKAKLLDPKADAIGLGLYFEVGGKTDELEIEAKLLLDKHFGDFGLAFNAVYEAEFEAEPEPANNETSLEIHAHELQFDLGFAYFITPRWSVALELVSRTEFAKEDDEFETEYSILSLGPTVGYAGERFWITASVLPQIAALKGATGDSVVHLEDKERLELRLLLGFEI